MDTRFKNFQLERKRECARILMAMTVYKPTPPGCTYKKFYDNYRGPFQITENTSHTYKIVLDRTKGTSDIVHMEHLLE